MLLNHVWLALLWTGYCVLHSVLAGLRVKARFRNQLGPRFRHYRLGYTVFAFLGLAAILWFQFSLHSVRLFRSSAATDFAGIVVSTSGLLLMAVCVKKYFINLSGLRSLFEEEVNPILEVRGVHGFVRHPLYLGTFFFIWGLLLLFPTASLLITVVVVTGYTLIGLELEEKKLVLQFGEAYSKYQATVPKLIPRLVPGKLKADDHRQKKTVRR